MPKKILVVDDDLETLKLVGLILDRKGYEIVAARHGEQALEKARAQQPDLIVLDVMMPDMDGYEVSRRLRTDPETAELPILMFTAKSAIQDRVTGLEAGADDFLSKPIHPQELVSRVESLLRQSAGQRPKHRAVISNVVGFLGCKGGVGTTTLVVNTAVAAARADGPPESWHLSSDERRVILAEMQSGMATAALQLGLPEHDGLGRMGERPIRQLDADFIEAQLHEHESGLLVLGSRAHPVGVGKALSAEHAETIVRHLGTRAAYVFLDLGVGLGSVNRRLLPLCRHVVLTIEPDSTALHLAEKLLAEINQSLHIARHRIGLTLVKRNRSAVSLSREAVEEQLRYHLLGMIPPAPELAFQSSKQQLPMVMAQLDSLVVQQYKSFARDLIETLCR